MISNLHKIGIGTNAGVSLTLTPASNRSVYLTRLIGYTDKKDLVCVKSTLTGTISTTSGSAVVTGVGTAFTSQLSIGDVVKVQTSNEYLTILSIASDTQFTATGNSSSSQSTKAGWKVLFETQTVADVGFDLEFEGDIQGIYNRPVIIEIIGSTARCALTATGKDI